ncbi:MAG: hypothetical protein V4578_24080 [Pseudomonadota bacterium]
MQKIISELTRLYLPDNAMPASALALQLAGQATQATPLTTDDGRTRALAIPFRRQAGDGPEQHWTRLCAVANALQTELGLPPPAVSITGSDGFRLWLSLETPVPLAQVDAFLALLQAAYLPDVVSLPGAAAPVELPPCLHRPSGKWAAFIHPDLGASFADEPGLDMAPPAAGQAALLERLHSIGAQQFLAALHQLEQRHGTAAQGTAPGAGAPPETGAAAPVTGTATPALATATSVTATATPASGTAAPEMGATAPDGLLLKDATLDDIVRFLHAKNIEPTFRHLLPK